MSMNQIDIKRLVLSKLQMLSVCIPNSSETQWVVRCPYCGDSVHEDHGHFSIKIDLDSDAPMLYRCFKCNESGIITTQVLQDLGCIVDDELTENLGSYNKKIKRNNPFLNMKNRDWVVPLCTNYEHNEKRYYINERLGLNYSFDDYRKLKVVFDIFDFMEVNKIKAIPNVSWKMLNFLNHNYVGFLSNNNTRITYRCIRKNEDMNRYYKLILDPYNMSPNNFYSIPNKFDLLYTDDIHIHLAEGTFDIISIFANVQQQNVKNNLYYASCGFNYNTILKYILNIGINTNIHCHIYSDNDKSDAEHKKYLLNGINGIWLDHIYIHRNGYPGEKDYGVPIDRIEDRILQIK